MDKREQRVIVRLLMDQPTNIDEFQNKYKGYLQEAETQQKQLSVLFDLRNASWKGYQEVCKPLIHFFTKEIKQLSEKIIAKCIIVIPNKEVAMAIGFLQKSCGGTIDTVVQAQMPSSQH